MGSRIPIYHITHKDNLANILKQGYLYCDHEAQKYLRRQTAYSHLKARRAMTYVPQGGTLDQYVPFYFAPRSPMLYAIYTGYVPGVAADQSPIVYLVTEVQTVADAGLKFAFCDRHPLSGWVRWSSNLKDLPQMIDWRVMQSLTWYNTEEYPDRKSRRQAEFLVHDKLPFGLIHRIGVYDRTVLQQVQGLLQSYSYQLNVSVERGWYY
ncbi:MAG: DUF4433 domain-containing protein [Fimbriimonadales bacterium]